MNMVSATTKLWNRFILTNNFGRTHGFTSRLASTSHAAESASARLNHFPHGAHSGAEESKENSNKAEKGCIVNSSPLLCNDPKRKVILDRMIRVDHAGEVGARQIYAGQLAVFRGTQVGNVIKVMAEQELKHLRAFNQLIVDRRVRPTVMMPLWNIMGYGLGLGTALLGKNAAMACTVAVEEVIAEHYNDQVRTLLNEDWKGEEELKRLFREFRDDELEHKNTGIEHDAESAPFYKVLSSVIKAGCRAAIFITERV